VPRRPAGTLTLGACACFVPIQGWLGPAAAMLCMPGDSLESCRALRPPHCQPHHPRPPRRSWQWPESMSDSLQTGSQGRPEVTSPTLLSQGASAAPKRFQTNAIGASPQAQWVRRGQYPSQPAPCLLLETRSEHIGLRAVLAPRSAPLHLRGLRTAERPGALGTAPTRAPAAPAPRPLAKPPIFAPPGVVARWSGTRSRHGGFAPSPCLIAGAADAGNHLCCPQQLRHTSRAGPQLSEGSHWHQRTPHQAQLSSYWLGGAGDGAVTVTKSPAPPLLCYTPGNSAGRNFPYLQNPGSSTLKL